MDLTVLSISMLIQVMMLTLGLVKNDLLICPVLGGILGLGTISDLLLGGNTLTYYAGSVPDLVTIQLGGFTYLAFLLLPLLSFVIVITGVRAK